MPPEPAPRTVGELLRQGDIRLRQGSVSSPRLTAETLLATVIGRDRAWLYAHPEAEADEERRRRYEELIERRLAGEPTHYILGAREFFGLELECGPGVLTPRPETEHLVEEALARAPEARRIVDVGCGAGTIALPLAQALSEARVVGTDISAEALAYAGRNARRHGLRLDRLRADLLAPIQNEALDLIVCNPPYLEESERGRLPKELDYEPDVALYGGRDGLAVYRRLAPEAFRTLRTGGLLIVELGFAQHGRVTEIFRDAGLEVVDIVEDLQGLPRVLVAGKPARSW